MIVRKVKNKNFTTISNLIFQNKNLSLKAKGLLALCLTLPDNWNFNKNGLMTFSTDGRSSIESAIIELKKEHYLIINKIKNENGEFDSEWVVYEEPYTDLPSTEKPSTEKPSTEKPSMEKPSTDLPYTENQHLQNNNIQNNKNKILNKQNNNIQSSADHSQIYKALEQAYSQAPTTWVIAINKYIDILSDELIINAIKETAIAGVTNPKYFTAICERYKINGYTKVTDIKTNKKNTKKIMDRDEYNKQFVEMMKNEKKV